MKWIKTDGQEIELNDLPATIEYAKSLGWKPADEKQEVKKVVKKKAKKAE